MGSWWSTPAAPPPPTPRITEQAHVKDRMWEPVVIGPVPHASVPGVLVYVMLPGTMLYHGTSHPDGADILQRPNFFSNPAVANIYCQRHQCGKDPVGGNLYEYQTRHAATLLALDDCETIRTVARLFEQHGMDPAAVEALRGAFDCPPDRITPLRTSYHDEDAQFFFGFCRHVLGVDGTAARGLTHGEEATAVFHGEIYLCNPSEILSFEGPVLCRYQYNCQLARFTPAPLWLKLEYEAEQDARDPKRPRR